MIELIESLTAGALWSLAFLLLVLNLRIAPVPSAQAVLTAYPLFCGFQIVLAKALGLAGWLTRPAILTAYLVAAAAGTLLYLRRRRSGLPPLWPVAVEPQPMLASDPTTGADVRLIRTIALGCAAAVVSGLALFSIVSPVHVWDVLAYHMPMVANYVQNASLEPFPTRDLRHVVRVNGGELQLLNVALLAGSDAWVELPNLLGVVVCLTASFELARITLRGRALPYLVVALVLTAPQIQVGSATAKNDLVFTAVLLCSFYWMIRAGQEPERASRHAALAALSGGLAAATKVMGLNVIGAVGLLALVLAARRRLPWRVVAVFTGVAVLTVLVLVGDVYWRNLARSAVPVGVAPEEVTFRTGPDNIAAAARYYLYDLSFKRLVVLQMFEHDLSHYGYFFPLLLAFGVAAGLRQALSRRARRFGIAALALLAAALFISVIAVRLPIRWDQRFMIWLVPALAILAASLAERLQVRHLLVLTTAAASVALVNLFLICSNEADGLFTRSATHLARTGTMPRYTDVPSRHYLFMNENFDVLARAASERDSILYVGTDDSWMYLAWGPRFTRYVRGVWDVADAEREVASSSHRFLVIEDEAADELREAVLAAALREGYTSIGSGRGRVVFVRRS